MTIASFVFVMAGVVCLLEQTHGMGIYWPYPAAAPSALSYPQLQAVSALIPADCDKKEESGSSESSSSESSSSESKEGESSSSSSSEEVKEGGEVGEMKEGGGNSEEGGKKEGGSGENGGESEEKKDAPKKKKSKKQKIYFPPYTFPPRRVQELVYTAPALQYAPYRVTYSVVQQPSSYINAPISKVYPSSYVRNVVTAPIARVISSPVSKLVSPVVYNAPAVGGFPALTKGYPASPGASVVSSPAAYWSPSSSVSYYKL